jgi:SCF-associated factor 1
MDEEGNKRAHESGGVVACVPWDLEMDPTRLPALPPLPDLANTGESQEDREPTQLIQIAGLDNCLVGLTNRGHVLKIDELRDDNSASRGHWEYVRRVIASPIRTLNFLLASDGQ